MNTKGHFGAPFYLSGKGKQMTVRSWYYYPIMMPVDSNGNGPCDVKDAIEITFEVWDRLLNTHGTFNNLPDAIDYAMTLNDLFSNAADILSAGGNNEQA